MISYNLPLPDDVMRQLRAEMEALRRLVPPQMSAMEAQLNRISQIMNDSVFAAYRQHVAAMRQLSTTAADILMTQDRFQAQLRAFQNSLRGIPALDDAEQLRASAAVESALPLLPDESKAPVAEALNASREKGKRSVLEWISIVLMLLQLLCMIYQSFDQDDTPQEVIAVVSDLSDVLQDLGDRLEAVDDQLVEVNERLDALGKLSDVPVLQSIDNDLPDDQDPQDPGSAF